MLCSGSTACKPDCNFLYAAHGRNSCAACGPLQEPQTLRALVEQERADVLCLQETKLKQADEVVAEAQLQALLPSWRMYWNSSTARKGYSGVALLSR